MAAYSRDEQQGVGVAERIRRISPRTLLLTAALLATPVRAQEAGPVDSPQHRAEREAAARRAELRETLTFDHWENGLDVKMTSLFNSSAFSLVSPSVILTAQWNYRFPTETRIGVTVSGMPQAQRAAMIGNATRTYTTYNGGIDVGQAVFAHNQYRLILNVAAGVGVVFVRSQLPDVVGSTVQRPNYSFVEPGGYLTFLTYGDLDIGFAGSYRLARLQGTVEGIKSSDVSSAALGLTFRTLLH